MIKKARPRGNILTVSSLIFYSFIPFFFFFFFFFFTALLTARPRGSSLLKKNYNVFDATVSNILTVSSLLFYSFIRPYTVFFFFFFFFFFFLYDWWLTRPSQKLWPCLPGIHLYTRGQWALLFGNWICVLGVKNVRSAVYHFIHVG